MKNKQTQFILYDAETGTPLQLNHRSVCHDAVLGHDTQEKRKFSEDSCVSESRDAQTWNNMCAKPGL